MAQGFCILTEDGGLFACDAGFLQLIGENDGTAVLGKPLAQIGLEHIRILLNEAYQRVKQHRGFSSLRLGDAHVAAAPIFVGSGEIFFLMAISLEKPLPQMNSSLQVPHFAFFQDASKRIVAVSGALIGPWRSYGFDFPEDPTFYLSPVEIFRAQQDFARLTAGQPILGEYYVLRDPNSGSPLPARITAVPVYQKGGEFFGVMGFGAFSSPEGEEQSQTLEEILITLRSLEKRLQTITAKGAQIPKKSTVSFAGLTPRKIEILRAIALGYSTREIARLLGISVNTVETHRRSIMRKLGLPSLAHLVRAAVFLGLVSENPWEKITESLR